MKLRRTKKIVPFILGHPINSSRLLDDAGHARRQGDVAGTMINNALSCSVEKFFKEFPDPHPEANDFQNLMPSSSYIDTSWVKYS